MSRSLRSTSDRFRRASAGTLALVVALVLLAAGSIVHAEPAGAQARHAVVVSDSIFLGAQAPFTSRLAAAGWTVEFDGAVSRSTLAGADAVRSRRPTVTDTLVVSLGANDSGNTTTFRSRVDAVMAAAEGVPNVYWLTIREVRPYYAPANQVLRDAAARYPNLHVVDWNAASAGRDGLTSGDGLHLTPAGAGELAGLVASSVTSGAAPVAAPPPGGPVAVDAEPAATPVAPDAATAANADPLPAPAPAEASPSAPDDGAAVAAPSPQADRSEPVTADGPVRVAAGGSVDRAGSAGAGPVPAAVVAAAVVGVVLLLRRTRWMPFALRSTSLVSRPSPVSRSELRAARIAGSMGRHPSVASVPPVPDEEGRTDEQSVVSGSLPET